MYLTNCCHRHLKVYISMFKSFHTYRKYIYQQSGTGDHYHPHPGRQRRSINSERGWTPRLGWNCQLWKCSLCTGPLSLYFTSLLHFGQFHQNRNFYTKQDLYFAPDIWRSIFKLIWFSSWSFQHIYWCQPFLSSEWFLNCFGLRTLAPNTNISLYFKNFWDPSQMITCHLEKIPKFLLTGDVVQFCHDVNQFFPQSGSYGVFTAVSSFRSWIDRTLSKYGGAELVCSWIFFCLKSSHCRTALHKEYKGWTFFGLYKDSLLLSR